jgi:hypothetical protein
MLKTKLYVTAVLISIFALIFDCKAQQSNQSQKDFLISNYGSKGDGKTINTITIQKAIDAAFKNKGGRVVFPKGNFLSGTIILKNNVSLYFEEGAVLLGSTNPKDYPNMTFEGRPDSPKKDDNSQMALIIAHKANNISLKGKGTIDGQGLQLALNIDSLHHAGIAVDPKYNLRRNRPNETMRPKLFRFSQCENITIQGLKAGEASCWGLSFELCHNLVLDNLKIVNRSYWNNDGIDITDCKNVKITNCDINAADDGICLKSYYPGFYNDSVYISNCTIRSSASAIKFGTASFGGFKNVTIKDIKVFDTFRSAIAIESVDGAFIENIQVSNINAVNTGNAIFIRLGNRSGDKPGMIKNISLKNIKVQVPFGRPDINYDLRGPEVDFFHNPFPSSIVGLKGHNVENVVLENIEINYPGRASKGMANIPLDRLDQIPEAAKDYPEFSMFGELPSYGFYLRHVNGISFKNIKLTLDHDDFRPAFVLDDVQDLKMEMIEFPNKKHKQIIFKNVNSSTIDNNLSVYKTEVK